MEFGDVGNKQGLVERSHASAIDVNWNRGFCLYSKVVHCVSDLGTATAAEVVDLTRLPILCQEAVSADDIADISEIANDVKVTDLDIPSPT